MNTQRAFEPPRSATWLLSLFAPIDKAETIVGDLFEEFSAMAGKEGIAAARRWYWRQAVKSIFSNAAAHGLVLLFTVIAGFWLIGWATRWSEHGMQFWLDKEGIYQSHPSLYLFLYTFPLELGRVLICGAIGIMMAFIARKIEIVAVASLALIQMLLFFVAAAVPMRGRGEWLSWFVHMGFWNTACAVGTIAGGFVMRAYRSRSRTTDELTPV